MRILPWPHCRSRLEVLQKMSVEARFEFSKLAEAETEEATAVHPRRRDMKKSNKKSKALREAEKKLIKQGEFIALQARKHNDEVVGISNSLAKVTEERDMAILSAKSFQTISNEYKETRDGAIDDQRILRNELSRFTEEVLRLEEELKLLKDAHFLLGDLARNSK